MKVLKKFRSNNTVYDDYTIKIDPVGQKVTFDPAVEEWGAESGELAIPLS